jgi:hypothetical protein
VNSFQKKRTCDGAHGLGECLACRSKFKRMLCISKAKRRGQGGESAALSLTLPFVVVVDRSNATETGCLMLLVPPKPIHAPFVALHTIAFLVAERGHSADSRICEIF